MVHTHWCPVHNGGWFCLGNDCAVGYGSLSAERRCPPCEAAARLAFGQAHEDWLDQRAETRGYPNDEE